MSNVKSNREKSEIRNSKFETMTKIQMNKINLKSQMSKVKSTTQKSKVSKNSKCKSQNAK